MNESSVASWRFAWHAALIASTLAACGSKDKPAGPSGGETGSGSARGSASAPPSGKAVRVTPAWTFGEPPKGEHGPRERAPNEPLPSGPAFVAAGGGRVVVATQDGCLELLDGATGTRVVPRRCELGAAWLGLAVVGDHVVVARREGAIGLALRDLAEVWRSDTGFVAYEQPAARPALVDGKFCLHSTFPNAGRAISCFEPATGKGPRWTIPGGARVAFGDRVIGVVDSPVPTGTPAPEPGVELPITIYSVEGKVVHETKLAGLYGPAFDRARPIFVLRGGGYRSGWRMMFLGPDGAELATIQRPNQIRGAGLVGTDRLVTTEFGSAGKQDAALAIRTGNGGEVWRADLGTSGPWDPYIAAIGGAVVVAHFDRALVLDAASGSALATFPLASEHHAVWRDRLVFLVSSRESRSDSDYGDAAVYAIDGVTRTIVLTDELGKDVPGGQQASDPVFDGDLAVTIAGGRVHAYRIAS